MPKTEVIDHYDRLIEEGNDPVGDPEPLRAYMDKWDGQPFIDALELSKDKTILEIGVGTGRLAVRTVPDFQRNRSVFQNDPACDGQSDG